MAKVLIIHGWTNRRPVGHWQRSLAATLRDQGHLVSYPQLPNPDQPILDEWLEVLTAELDQFDEVASRASEPLIVLAHSLGCVAWMQLADRGLLKRTLEKLAGERVGLVVVAGTSFLQAPLSADYEILREFLPGLNPGFLPEAGTNYGAMLDTAAQAFGTTGAADRFLIVLSDGEATDPSWKERIEPLKKRGIRVLGLGVGTAGGGITAGLPKCWPPISGPLLRQKTWLTSPITPARTASTD